MNSPYLTRREAAEYSKTPEPTLATMATRGGGPPYIKRGSRVLYRVADLDVWLLAGLRTSTSSPSQPGPLPTNGHRRTPNPLPVE
jgi:hypothetical protein